MRSKRSKAWHRRKTIQSNELMLRGPIKFIQGEVGNWVSVRYIESSTPVIEQAQIVHFSDLTSAFTCVILSMLGKV